MTSLKGTVAFAVSTIISSFFEVAGEDVGASVTEDGGGGGGGGTAVSFVTSCSTFGFAFFKVLSDLGVATGFGNSFSFSKT
ncbi:hypothetical protein BC829DRAFT_395233 [Chytridium lagenaria]|nr:hypothetical protein BC829DRAFT_395233 [Chytridium lagenaria]